MKPQDFDRMPAYKWFLPSLYILNWILMFVGPTYFPVFYSQYYMFCLVYLTFRTCFSCIWTHIGSIKAQNLMNTVQTQRLQVRRDQCSADSDQKKSKSNDPIQHIFVIPNYNQEEKVLSMTIQKICSHHEARQRFSVFLAMEQHQLLAEHKALKLVNKYRIKLKHIGFTVHQLKKHQQRGKAANVSWCVQHLEQDYFKPQKIEQKNVILTIIDADSWVPDEYIKQVDKHIQAHNQKTYSTIFQPCQMFTRNQFQVPFIVRYYDMAHGLVHFSNLFSLFGISFPLSNYSLSYSLAKKIGFWDTCPDAIGEDFHTTIKAFWKTRGKVTTVPIFTPFDQLSIHTGKGFWTDVSKRFWQAERHGRGCADAAYNLKNLIQNEVNWRTFLIAFQSLQITTFPAILPWCLTSVSVIRLYSSSYFKGQANIDGQLVSWLYNICTLASVWMFIRYDSVCRRASSIYFKSRSKSYFGRVLDWLIRVVCYNVTFFISIFTITIPSVTLAVFRIVLGQSVYQTAQKKVTASFNRK